MTNQRRKPSNNDATKFIKIEARACVYKYTVNTSQITEPIQDANTDMQFAKTEILFTQTSLQSFGIPFHQS